MKAHIIPVSHPQLRQFIQYYIFFHHQADTSFSYKTFPNTNLCLAIYKQNHIVYTPSTAENSCRIKGGGPSFPSRLYGFHTQPFQATINGEMEEYCILFHPHGLRAFSEIPYHELMEDQQVFHTLFPGNEGILEQLFTTNTPREKTTLLENFLIKKIRTTTQDPRTTYALDNIHHSKGDITINKLATLLQINTSTLYRHFTNAVGQNPKDYIQTVRFRHALTILLNKQCNNLTEIGYTANFYDQSHFIRDFKARTGDTPLTLQKNIQLKDNILAWILGEQH